MLTKEDRRLFLALVAWALLPSLYTLVRMQIVAVNGVDLNILGQMEWFDLIDEVLVTTLTIPLYSLLKPKSDGGAGTNAAAFLISFAVYAAFTALAVRHIAGISAYMNAAGAERYLAMQAISMLIGFVALFGVLLLTINVDVRAVRRLTLIRLASVGSWRLPAALVTVNSTSALPGWSGLSGLSGLSGVSGCGTCLMKVQMSSASRTSKPTAPSISA